MAYGDKSEKSVCDIYTITRKQQASLSDCLLYDDLMTQGLIQTIINIATYSNKISTYSGKNEVAAEVYRSCAEF